MSKRIPLTQAQMTIVDDEDYEWLLRWRWYYVHEVRGGYAVRSQWEKATKTRKRIQMSRVIMRRFCKQDLTGLIVDHINGNALDNRRCNLRVCTVRENAYNRKPNANSSSQYRGVTWLGHKGKWQAGIKVDGRNHHLGQFDDEKAAARAYDRAAALHFGEYARLNDV